MPETVRAVVVDPSSPQGLGLKPVELAPAAPDEVSVRVTAISLNRGEVRRATTQGQAGDRPGWDFVGIVEERAADGSGPAVGSRVVGLLASGAWAERVRAPSHSVAPLPEAVTDAQAATLPVAGLTALHALRQGGLLIGRKVLVDGAAANAAPPTESTTRWKGPCAAAALRSAPSTIRSPHHSAIVWRNCAW